MANRRIHIIYFNEILEYAGNLESIIQKYDRDIIDCKMWMPSVKAIENNELKELLEQYKISFFSMEYFENDLIRNFDNNISLNDDNIDDIRKII